MKTVVIEKIGNIEIAEDGKVIFSNWSFAHTKTLKGQPPEGYTPQELLEIWKADKPTISE